MGRKMKLIFSCLLALMLFFSCTLVGCEKKPKDDMPDDTKEPVDPPSTSQSWDRWEESEVADPDVQFSFVKDMPKVEKVYVLTYDFGEVKPAFATLEKFSELASLVVMQGLIMKDPNAKETIYLNVVEGGTDPDANRVWLEEMVEYDGLEAIEVQEENGKTPFVQMMEKFAGEVAKTDSGKPGYVLYQQEFIDGTDSDGFVTKKGKESYNAACTAAGVTGYLAVDACLAETFDSLGYEQAMSVVGWNDEDAFDEFKDEVDPDMIITVPNTFPHNRDYGVAIGALFIDEQYTAIYQNKNDTFATKLQQHYPDPGAVMMGWSSISEGNQLELHASFGFGLITTNYSYNLTVFMSQGKKAFKQRNQDQKIQADPNKHYVAMVLTDGDNVSWHQTTFNFDEAYLGYSANKELRAANPFKMGYTTSGVMADLLPAVMRYEYETCSPYDYFVASVGGVYTTYPSYYLPLYPGALEREAEATNEYMRRSDLRYLEILDRTVFDMESLDYFTKQPDIEGIFMLRDADYYKAGGELRWQNGKPILGCGEAFWTDTAGRVAHRLNSMPADNDSVNGYTLLKVHCWSTTLQDVANMVSKLDDHIEIVSPGELMDLIIDNVPHVDQKRTVVADTNYPDDVDEYLDPTIIWDETPLNDKYEFNFDTYQDYEGWQKYIGSKTYDNVTFSGEPWIYSTQVQHSESGEGYCVRLDGGDLGNEDKLPNSAIYTKLLVPKAGQQIFRFFARGEAYGYDCDYRVRILYKNDDGEFVIERLTTGMENTVNNTEWTEIGDNDWRDITFELPSYLNGKEVIFVIEHNGSYKEGDGEILYIDNITLGTDPLDAMGISALLSSDNKNVLCDFSSDAQSWKYEGANEAGYDSTEQALFAQTSASVSANGAADALFYTRYTLPSSTDFTHFKFGAWFYAQEGKTAKVRLGMILPTGKVVRASSYKEITDEPTYLSMNLDAYRITGGPNKNVKIFVEIASAGESVKVFMDNTNFAKWHRNYEQGYLFDLEYLNTMPKTSAADAIWTPDRGRGLEDEAYEEDGKFYLYGYDFGRRSEEGIISKALNRYPKLTNEYNARLISRIDVGTAQSLEFTIQRITETKLGAATTDTQYRVVFVQEDGTVLTLCDWTTYNTIAEKNASVDLGSVQNMSGALVLEMDIVGNNMRGGFVVNQISIN